MTLEKRGNVIRLGKVVVTIICILGIILLKTGYLQNRGTAKFSKLGFEFYRPILTMGIENYDRDEVVIGACDESDVLAGKIKREDLEYVNVYIKTDKEPVVLKLKYKGHVTFDIGKQYFFDPEIKKYRYMGIDVDKVIKMEQYISK